MKTKNNVAKPKYKRKLTEAEKTMLQHNIALIKNLAKQRTEAKENG